MDGSRVNIGLMRTLTNMGFGEDHALAAMKQTGNDINAAVDMLQNSPDLVDLAVDALVAERVEEESRHQQVDKRQIVKKCLLAFTRYLKNISNK